MKRYGPSIRGFTYLLLLWWVAIGGVTLTALAASWRVAGQRERELEMVFRAEQIVQAIQSYQTQTGNLPQQLQVLVDGDPQMNSGYRLRRLWNDPVTRGAWGLLKEGNGISGVYSTSTARPLSAPANVASYADWHFRISGVHTPSSQSLRIDTDP